LISRSVQNVRKNCQRSRSTIVVHVGWDFVMIAQQRNDQ